MDREGVVNAERDVEAVRPAGASPRKLLERLVAAAVFLGGLALKFGFVFLKFAGLFVSVGAYALLGGWQWGIGLVGLILVHEMGHWLEARRQGLHASWPTFVPFLGAFVTIKHAGLTPWRSALIALAGPFVGGLGAAACWWIGSVEDSQTFTTLAYTGFFLNLFNLIPVGFLDGGAVARAGVEAWRMPVIQFDGDVPVRALRPDRSHAVAIGTLYLVLAIVLVYGMVQAHVPQHRL